jgi:hypothetical protein
MQASGTISLLSASEIKDQAKKKPKIPPETIELIRKMAKENRLWGD